MNLTKRLEELLEWSDAAPSTKLQIKDTLTAIEQDILDLIGPDEERPTSGPKRNGIEQGLRRARNKEKRELRTKLHNYIRGQE